MKLLIFQIKYDCVNGILGQWKKYALLAAVYATLIMDFVIRCKIKGYAGEYSMGDMILWLFKGTEKIDASLANIIDIPVAYILPNILIAFIVGNYPFKDLNGFGNSVLIRARKKSVWWAAKCIWAVLSVFTAYAVMAAELLSVCIFSKNISLVPTSRVCSGISGYDKLLVENAADFDKIALTVLAGALITSIALSILQICISQIVSPLIGYISVIALLVAGVFFSSGAVVTNGFMAVRNRMYIPGGYDTWLLLSADLLIIIIAVAAGMMHFVKTDIFNKSEWRI